MVAFDGPRPNSDPPKTGGDVIFTAASFRRCFSDLVAAMDQGTDLMPAALNFSSVAIEALHLGHVQPEVVIECMKLRNPASGQKVFVEQGCFPGLVKAVCVAVSEHLRGGKPVSSTALEGLRHFASSPQFSGVGGSLFSYHTFVRGLTHFYQVMPEGTSGESAPFSPGSLMGAFAMDLHRNAVLHPVLVAEVVEALGAAPVSPRLLSDLDSLLWNTAHPARSGMLPQVRAAALRAIAARVSCPPVQVACDPSVGIIDMRGVFDLFVSCVKGCPQPEVVRVVLDTMSDLLRDEADRMRLSWDSIESSSFFERKGRCPVGSELKDIFPLIEDIFAGSYDSLARMQQLDSAIRQADRIDGALMLHGLGEFIGKVTPRSWAPRVQRALLSLLR